MTNSSNIIKLALLYVLVVAGQVLVLNNLQISGFVNPYIYILFIMTMPFGTPVPLLMVLSMALGFTIDLCCDTPGMHAAACVLVAYIRPYLLKLIAFRDSYKEDSMPTIGEYDILWYLKYTVTVVTCHHIALFFIEQFDTLFFWPTLLRIICSIIATTLLIIILQLFMPIRNDGGR